MSCAHDGVLAHQVFNEAACDADDKHEEVRVEESTVQCTLYIGVDY